MNKKVVRNFVEIYYDTQDVRIRTENRLREIGEVKGINPKILKELEGQIRKFIANEIKGSPLAVYLLNFKGIGAILAGGLMSYFDIYKADHISSFWKYAGQHVENGKAVKRTKGKKLDYNPKVRTLMWKVGDSFVKQQTPFYVDIYYKTKIEENIKLGNPLENPKNCPMYEECMKKLKKAKQPSCKDHIHMRGLRKMTKQFLADYWLFWRKLEGLPVTEPYSHRHLRSENQHE